MRHPWVPVSFVQVCRLSALYDKGSVIVNFTEGPCAAGFISVSSLPAADAYLVKFTGVWRPLLGEPEVSLIMKYIYIDISKLPSIDWCIASPVPGSFHHNTSIFQCLLALVALEAHTLGKVGEPLMAF